MANTAPTTTTTTTPNEATKTLDPVPTPTTEGEKQLVSSTDKTDADSGETKTNTTDPVTLTADVDNNNNNNNNEDGASVTDTQRKIRRVERFGMPVKISEEEKRNSRAERKMEIVPIKDRVVHFYRQYSRTPLSWKSTLNSLPEEIWGKIILEAVKKRRFEHKEVCAISMECANAFRICKKFEREIWTSLYKNKYGDTGYYADIDPKLTYMIRYKLVKDAEEKLNHHRQQSYQMNSIIRDCVKTISHVDGQIQRRKVELRKGTGIPSLRAELRGLERFKSVMKGVLKGWVKNRQEEWAMIDESIEERNKVRNLFA